MQESRYPSRAGDGLATQVSRSRAPDSRASEPPAQGSVRRKISVALGGALALIALLAVFSGVSLFSARGSLEQVVEATSRTVVAGDLAEDMHWLQNWVATYVETLSGRDLDRVYEAKAELMARLNARPVYEAAKIEALVGRYMESFEKVRRLLLDRRDVIEGTLDRMREELNASLTTISGELGPGDPVTLENMAVAQWHVLRAQYHVQRYIQTSRVEEVTRARAEFDEAAAGLWLVSATLAERGLDKALERVMEMLPGYEAAFDELVRLTKEAEAQLAGSMNVTGSDIRAEARRRWYDASRDVRTRTEHAEEAVRRTLHAVALVSLAVLVLGGTVLMILVRGTVRPLGRLTVAIQRVAGGDLETKIEGVERRDEIGALARAVEVFRTTTLELRAREQSMRVQSGLLRDSEERMRAILNNNNAIVYLKDTGGRYIFINQAFERSFGVSALRAEGRTDVDLFGGARADGFRRRDREAIAGGGLTENEEVTYLAGGPRTHLAVRFPLHDHDGKVYAVCGILTDITERKRAEEELRAERDRAERYLDVAEAVIVTLDRRGRISLINQRGCDLLGYALSEIVGLDWFGTVVPADERKRTREGFDRAVETGVLDNPYVEGAVLTKSGERRAMFWHNTVTRDRQGGVSGTLSSGQDITDRKKAETSLRENEEKYRSIVETTSEGFLIFDFETGLIIDANESLAVMLGLERRDVIGRPLLGFSTPDARDAFAQSIAEAETRKHRRYETEMMTAADEVLEVTVNATTLYDRQGRPFQSFAFVTDVSERKRLEAQLRQAQKLETIGTLAGGIAHDFNNILTPIVGYTHMLMDQAEKGTPTHKRLNRIARGTKRATDLVQQILTFARRTEVSKGPVHLAPLIKEALKLIRSTVPTTIDIQQDLDGECPAVLGDPTQIHQLVMNLCTNAFQAMEVEGGVLSVSLGQVVLESEAALTAGGDDLAPGSYAEIRVADSGHGIPPAVMERIFDPFFTTKGKGKGTGLGLATAHGIVKGHGGAITVESAPDQGTTFRILLPVMGEEAATAAKREGDASEDLRGEGRLMVVDDEIEIVEMAVEMLEGLGYEVEGFIDGLSALEVFQEAPMAFDLVVTDQTMHGITGDVLAERLREIRPDLPVIMISGFSTKMSTDAARDMGIQAYLMKPLRSADLGRAIRDALASAESAKDEE